MRGLPLYLDGNDDEPQTDITRRNVNTGELEPASGLGGLTYRLSATDDGTTIDASLQVTATERVSTAGEYYGTYQGSDLTAHLTTYAGKDVRQILSDGGNINLCVFRRVLAVRRD